MAQLTIPDETTFQSYVVTGSQSAFPFAFAIFSKADLQVQVGAIQLDPVQFTLSGTPLPGGGYQGGTVNLLTPAAATTVVIWRDIIPARTSNFTPSTSVPVRDIDTALNRAMAIDQDFHRDSSRAVLAPFGSKGILLPDTATRAGKLLGFDGSGLFTAYPPADGGVTPTLATLSYTAPFANAVAQSAYNKLSSSAVSITDWDALAGSDGLDNTAIINLALADIYAAGNKHTLRFPGGLYKVTEASVGAGYCIINPGVCMEGEGRLGSNIYAASSVGSTVDLMRVRPSGYSDFIRFRDLLFNTAGYAGRGIYVLADQVCAVDNMVFEGLYIGPSGHGYSLEMYNDGAVNPQGIPFGGLIRGGYYAEGIKLTGVSDSFRVENPIVRTNLTSNIGFEYTGVTDLAGDNPAGLVIDGFNVDAKGGSILLHSGRYPQISGIDAEQSSGTGTSNGAVIELRGDVATIVQPNLQGVSIGVFGTSAVTSMVRFGAVVGGIIDNYAMISGATGGGFTQPRDIFYMSSLSSDVCIGTGEVPNVGHFTYGINDNVPNTSPGTRGLPYSLTPVTGFTNVGAGYQVALSKKAHNGRVSLAGWLSCPATPSGKLVCTLPAGHRPSATEIFPITVATGGGFSTGDLQITAAGDVTFYGDNATTNVSLSGIGFDTNQFVNGAL